MEIEVKSEFVYSEIIQVEILFAIRNIMVAYATELFYNSCRCNYFR
ncbi:MAG: hypothetical protein WBA54_00930 [Acidaminobacteraceae bacterium]